jgi:hypothetical protein
LCLGQKVVRQRTITLKPSVSDAISGKEMHSMPDNNTERFFL